MTAENAGSQDCENSLMEMDINLGTSIIVELRKFCRVSINQEFD